jgi:hypothetical protein
MLLFVSLAKILRAVCQVYDATNRTNSAITHHYYVINNPYANVEARFYTFPDDD